ncbi:MAG: proteasome assembly chaperone family protein [Methanomicrobiales archaeon]|jgi:uncharacterized protein (TIGR00162 family)|nr:proteasome assembly chaperone family protein [Methanomicrobiales archaeon]
MKDIITVFVQDCPTNDKQAPVLIEGLPGIGHVGKLVAEHLIHELQATKVAEVFSTYFPPQALVEENGVARLCNNELYRYEDEHGTLLILVGDFQSTTNEGHYHLSHEYVRMAVELGVRRIYTLGGYGVGNFVEEPRVIGVVNDAALCETVKEAGAVFEVSEPGAGIIGAAGLMIGFAKMHNIEGICLMGETSGYLVDPKAATAVLHALSHLIQRPIDVDHLTKRAEEMEAEIAQFLETNSTKSDDELTYIG